MLPVSFRAGRCRRAIVMLCITMLAAPSAAVAAEDPQEDLRERKAETKERVEHVHERLEDTRGRLSENQRQQSVTVEDLDRIGAEQARLQSELAALADELDRAQDRLDEAEALVRGTEVEIARTETHLHDTQEALEYRRALFSDRARSSYMFGGAAYAELVLDLEDLNEFGQTVGYMRTVLRHDRDRVHEIASLEREVQAALEQLGDLRARQTSELGIAQKERDQVAAIVAERRKVQAQLEVEHKRHQTVLAQLEAAEESSQELVASLEAESDQLAADLADIAAEEERLRQEERRRREREERRRRAAAQAAREAAEREAAQREAAERRAAAREEAPQGGGNGSVSSPQSGGPLAKPVSGGMSSSFGWRTHPIFGTRRFHSGTDFAAASGTPIHAAADGVVHTATTMGGYGNTVVLNHGGGLATLYAHQSRLAVSVGERVARGQVIGYVGSTGYSTGPHLHFEVRVGGAVRNPARYL